MNEAQPQMIEVHLKGVPPEDYPAVLQGMACHMGLEDMLKAHDHGGEGYDPRLPHMFRLIDLAREDWAKWGEKLIDEVLELHDKGRLFPLTDRNERALVELFADHREALILRFSRPPGELDAKIRARLARKGLIDPHLSDTSWLEVSYRLGRAMESLTDPPEGAPSRETLAELVKRAQGQGPPPPADRAAVDYIRRKGAIYMRKVAHEWTGETYRVLAEADRQLSGDDLARVRGAIERGYRKLSTAALARELKVAVEGTHLTNNMTRVARTEIVNAHAHGAYSKLKIDAEKLGLGPDPQVYKLVANTACRQCVRIWGKSAAPHIYRLSEIEANERAGGNFRQPAADWVAVIGPIHPNCTEGALLIYSDRIMRGARALSERMAEGRMRR